MGFLVLFSFLIRILYYHILYYHILHKAVSRESLTVPKKSKNRITLKLNGNYYFSEKQILILTSHASSK